MKAAIFICAVLVSACDGRATKTEVPGLYRTAYAGMTDVLNIGAEGTYEHTVQQDRTTVLHEKGTWMWETEGVDDNDRVSFDRYTCMVPGMQSSGLWPAIVEKHLWRVRLVLDEDVGLYYRQDRVP